VSSGVKSSARRRMAVAGQHDLSAIGQQGVEGVQELFLRGTLGGQEVQVVDEQGVALAELPAKRGQFAEAHRLHKSDW